MARSGVFGRALGTARKGAGCRVHFMVSCHLRDALPPAPLVATGVDADGHARSSGSRWPRSRTVPGVWRSCASWSLRGPTGVQLLIISDAYRGLAAAVESTPPRAGWQRCRTHYLRNLLPRVLKSVQLWEATLVRTIFDQPPPKTSMPQHAHVVAWLETEHPDAAEHLGAPPTTCRPSR
ncbi:transposase [Actinomadura madurae]|uniref:transposase n=1 Tax=Actinomadura madurae TaxID=1993 RepID=UPI0027E34203|nr:transposase [Actinomadura madurae]